MVGGFRVELETSFVILLLPAMYASRTNKKTTSADNDATSELRLPLLINRIFEAIMTIELQLIRVGMSIPAGSPLLLIARRPANEV